MADHTRRVNDVLPPLDCTLQESSEGTLIAFNITGYTVRFVMRSSANTVIADATTSGDVTVLSSTAGRVRMNFSSSHVDTPGSFLAEWELKTASTQRITFPSASHISIVLKPELAST